jgi:hypothetical protein
MGTIIQPHRFLGQGVVGLIALSSVLLVACGTAAPSAPTETATATTVPPEPVSQATTPTPEPTAAPPGQAQSAKDTVILVTSAEPGSLGHSLQCYPGHHYLQ